MMMVEIRPLHSQDSLNDLITLSRAFFAEYEQHDPAFFGIDDLRDSDIINYFSRWLDDDAGETFVAVDNGRIIGYITVYVQDQSTFWQVKQVGHISGLMVAPAYRQQGIATRLLAETRSFFRQQGVDYFVVFTAVANHSALHFYKQTGLTPLYTTFLGKIQ
jgi:ribosomal protein S18 acetylase RimI-like enzyme